MNGGMCICLCAHPLTPNPLQTPLAWQAKAAAAHAVEEAEQLAEEIMQDIKDAVVPHKTEEAVRAHVHTFVPPCLLCLHLFVGDSRITWLCVVVSRPHPDRITRPSPPTRPELNQSSFPPYTTQTIAGARGRGGRHGAAAAGRQQG